MKNLHLLWLTLAFLTISSCSFLKKGKDVGFEVVILEDTDRDSTLYGSCGRSTTANRLQLITDTGDTLFISITRVSREGKILGGIRVGERLAVVPNADSTEAVHVVNVTSLMGDWVMEDPIDGSEEVGVSLKDGGLAESINQTTVQYESWRMVNGQLELTNTRDDGVDFEEVFRYKLIAIEPDTLVMVEQGNPTVDARADTYRYSRQKNRTKYVPGTDIESSDFEDFMF